MGLLLHRRLSDEQLGSRLAKGEAAAFDELYRRYVHRLAAYGANLLGDGAAGDDVAQSTLLKAYGALRDGRLPAQVRPWLYRIAHNVAIDLVRRRREVPAATLPEGVAAPGEDAGALVAALAALPDRQRRVYVLRELHGLRIDETAAELSLTVPQVEQALFAARNRLAEHLVFGDRLNCASVRRLAAGPLDLAERRALKTHLRSCPACRSELGLRGRALGAMPLAPAEWLQTLGGLFAGGGAPIAAKVGVLVAGATVAASVPLAADRPGSPFQFVARLQRAAVPAAQARPARVRDTDRSDAVAAATTTAAPRPAPERPLLISAAPKRVVPAVDKRRTEHEAEPADTGDTETGSSASGDDPAARAADVPRSHPRSQPAPPTTAPAEQPDAQDGDTSGSAAAPALTVTTSTQDDPAATVTVGSGSDGGGGGGGGGGDAGSQQSDGG